MLINTFFLIWISSNFVVSLYYKGGTTRFLSFFCPKMAKTTFDVVKTRSDVVKTTSDVVFRKSDLVKNKGDLVENNGDLRPKLSVLSVKTSFFEKNTKKLFNSNCKQMLKPENASFCQNKVGFAACMLGLPRTCFFVLAAWILLPVGLV